MLNPGTNHAGLFYGAKVAAGLGFATIVPAFDFETKSAAGYDLGLDERGRKRWVKKQGANPKGIPVCLRAYVEHETFGVLSLAYDLKDGRGRRRWRPGDADPLDLFAHVHAGKLLEAHNAEFEFNVWAYHLTPKLGWPALKQSQLRCSAAKARAHAYPGALAKLSTVLNLEHGKLKDGKRLIDKFSKPRNPTLTDDSLWRDPRFDPKDGPKLYEYNEVDIQAEEEASLQIPDLTPFELEVWQLDQRINDRGVRVDVIGIDNCIAIVEQASERYNLELWKITGGAVTAASEVEALKNWLREHGCHMEDMKAETVAERLKAFDNQIEIGAVSYEEIEPLYRALEIRAALGSASVAKLFAMRDQRTALDRLHSLYIFYGSRTGRWTGAGPQPQNLYKGRFDNIKDVELALSRIATRSLDLVEYYYGDALEAVNSCLRSLFIASPGKKLISSDYSAIEGVVTAAIADEAWALEVFRTHGLIYEATASTITGIPFEKFVQHRTDSGGIVMHDHKGNITHIIGGKHHPMRNKQGKYGALASGFGGWIGAWKAFGADEYMTDLEIKAAILAWREKSPNTVETWGGQTRDKFRWGMDPRPELFGLEGAAIMAIQNPGQAYWGNKLKTVRFQMHGDCLYMECPGGGVLTYHEPRLNQSTRDYAEDWELEISFMGYNTNPKKGMVGWIRMKLYGGLLMENAVQHTARYILASAMLRLEAAGYPIVLHTHDEFLAEVDADDNTKTVEAAEAIASIMPPGCEGWPIKCKGGWEGPRYGKFE